MYHKLRHTWSNFAPIKEIFTMRTINFKTIQSPEEVALIMENMWLRHKTGMGQRSDNVFFVDLPPLTEEEREEIRRKDALAHSSDYTQEELYGGWA